MIGVILLVTVQLVLARDQNCAFQIPSTTSTGSCNFYSLKKQGELGIFEVNGTDYHKEQVIYYFTLCQSIPKDKLPKECVNLPDGPAFMYKIKTQGCYLLGNIASNIAVKHYTYMPTTRIYVCSFSIASSGPYELNERHSTGLH